MLIAGIALVSVVITLLSFGTGAVGPLYLIPVVFIVAFIALLLVWASSCVVYTLLAGRNEPGKRTGILFRFYANGILDTMLLLFRVRLHVTGMEHLPRSRFLLVGNHRSAFDPIIEMWAFRRHRIGFVAKQELFKIPIVGTLMRQCFCFSLDRKSLRDGLIMMNKAADTIRSQTASVGIYPEGTRSQEDALLPFQNGAFKIAQKAGSPIVVVALLNSASIRSRFPFRRTDVYLRVAGVIDGKSVASMKTAQISQTVRGMMEQAMRVQPV